MSLTACQRTCTTTTPFGSQRPWWPSTGPTPLRRCNHPMDWQKTMPSTYQKPTAPLDLTAISEAKFSRLKWRMLLATMFCYLFFYTGRQTFGFAIPGIQADLGLSKATLGAISATMLWCYAAGQMINGNVADKFGGRRLMTLGGGGVHHPQLVHQLCGGHEVAGLLLGCQWLRP